MEIAPINFCNKIAFNLRNEKYKNNVLKELFNESKVIVTENTCSIYDKRYSKVIVNQFNNPYHILSTNTKGNRYYLYFRRDEFDKNMCLFIDCKICRGYTQPRVIYTNFKMDNDIFDGTLVHGELVKTMNNEWIFILNNIFSYCGKSLKYTKKIDRIQYLYNFLQKQYTSDDILDVCTFQIKRYFTYTQLDDFMNYVKTLPYMVNGILFNSLNPSKNDILLLQNITTAYKYIRSGKSQEKDLETRYKKDKDLETRYSKEKDLETRYKKEEVIHKNTNILLQKVKQTKEKDLKNLYSKEVIQNKSKSKSSDIANTKLFIFYITKIEGGIFQLISYVNKNEKVFGNARIDKMKTQRMVEQLLCGKEKVLVECKYNMKFNKFIPCGAPKEDVDEPSQYLDVTKYVASLKKTD
jgi:hypothetical protein